MAVPKRKMSRSNTRHRRSQWKAVAPDPGDLRQPRLRCQAPPAPCVRRSAASTAPRPTVARSSEPPTDELRRSAR